MVIPQNENVEWAQQEGQPGDFLAHGGRQQNRLERQQAIDQIERADHPAVDGDQVAGESDIGAKAKP